MIKRGSNKIRTRRKRSVPRRYSLSVIKSRKYIKFIRDTYAINFSSYSVECVG